MEVVVGVGFGENDNAKKKIDGVEVQRLLLRKSDYDRPGGMRGIDQDVVG